MRLSRFYCPETLAPGARVRLPPEAAHHAVRVLRLAEGAPLIVFNGDGNEYAARILRIERQDVVVLIEGVQAVARESPLAVTLLQGISAGERMDYTLQKCVELGVHAIQPIRAERSVVRLGAERAAKRLKHWQGVIVAACEQCGRNRLPQLSQALSLAEWAARCATDAPALRLMLAPEASLTLREVPPPDGAAVLAVGPEGGFSENERLILAQTGFVVVRLGPRILRTETAAVAALAALQSRFGDL